MNSDKNDEPIIPSLEVRESFTFPEDFDCIKLMVEWISKQNGLVSDLDLNMYCYDERARFIEKIDSYNKISKDQSIFLVGKVDSSENSHVECLKFDFRLVKQSTTAILIYLDGGPRNFHFLQSVNIQCLKVIPDRSYGDFLPNEDTTSGKNDPVFKIFGRTRKNYQGLALCVLYKDGWNDASQTPRWVAKSFLEPMFVSSVKDKLEKCSQLVVNAVPALEKFRMRLFSHIKDICSALSSHALPKLKKKFQKNEEGLQIGQFTEVLFKQLYESHPRIIEEAEAAYTVAMLQEMFYQIDYNGDCSTNWDEFTTFCVQTGVTGLMGKNGGAYSLDQYVIEYSEAMLLRDHVLSAYRFIAQMRHVPDTRKILVVPEDSDNILIFDEKLRLYAQLYPTKVQVISNISKGDINDSQMNGNVPRPMIYDVVYLLNRDMYAYASSDHSITIAKEFSSMGGKKINYMQYNRFFHSLLHLKLCWSAKNDILCSVASDRTIYGWNIDTANIIFQVSRHSDIITDFIAVDPLDIFITCSMDKRIVMWSATSRRVKGILLGHKRGVRSVNVYENLLLSAGFECEAKLWDMTTKDCIGILKGHRNPIVAAKLICEKAMSEKEHRAVTVDELGEFRLWNIYIRERSTDPQLVPTLQIFEMQSPENPINQFRFLALPYTPKYSTSYYSNIIACSTKLLQFIPEKNTKEFIPPGASVLSEAASCLVTAVGKSLLTYDISNGQFTSIFENVCSHDISALCMDGERGRRMYVGTGSGELLLVNSMNGSIIDSIHFHTKEITSLQQVQGHSRNCIFSASMDGSMRMYEESSGKLHTHNSVDNAFGEGIGVQSIKVALKLHTFIGVSVGRLWGIWHTVSFKKQLVIHMPEVITAVEIVGSSRDKAEEEFKAASNMSNSELFRYEKENILTLAVAMTSKVCIYTFDVVDLRGICSYELTHSFPMCINQLACIRSPDLSSMNYSSNRANSGNAKPGSHQLVGACDDGYVLVWDIDLMRLESDAKYRAHFKNIPLPARNVPHSKQIKHSNIQPIDHSFLPVHRQRHVERQIAAGMQVDPHADEISLTSSVSTPNGTQNRALQAASAKVTNSLPSTIAANAAKKAKKLKASEDAKYRAAFLTELEHNHHGTHHNSASAKERAVTPNPKKGGKDGKDNNKEDGKNVRGKATKVVDNSNSWLELEARHMFVPVNGEKKVPQMMATKCFNAHNDSIPILVPMNGNSCFTTVSHDGYHRVFNLEMEVLGELTLPNITDHMKSLSMCREPGTGWRFILERIPVTKHHVDIANTLVKSLKQTRQEKQLEHQLMNERRFNTVPLGFKGFSEASVTDSVVSTQQAQLRYEMLKSLTEPPAPNLDAPPSRLPTKEEKELIRMSITMDKLTAKTPENGSIVSRAVTPKSPKSSVPPSGGSGLGSLEIGEKGFNNSITTAKTPPMSGKSTGRGKGLRASALFGDSTVSLSGFGGPSLWSVPGEVDIFGSVTKKDAKERSVPPAFSEASLSALHKEGSIDMEGIHMLRKISKDVEKIQVYDRCLPTLLVRNPSMSTSVSLPSLDAMRKTEIHFGAQKDMYKNAEKVLNEKENLSKAQIRNAVAMARIEMNVRKVNTMIHLIQPPSHDEVILPKNHSTSDQGNEELQKLRTEEQKMKIRLLKSASLVSAEARQNMRPLDRESIDKWVSKMKHATEYYGDGRSRDDPKKKKREILSAAALNALEKQLQMAIRGEYRSKLAKVSKSHPTTPNTDEQQAAAQAQNALVAPTIAATEIKKALTTRALLPYYKLESVHQFMDIFAKVDENFSGDLDVNEWIKLFTSLNESIPVQEARMIFMKIDKDCDGYLTMRELVPVVFSKATREQQRLIIAYAEMELTKKVEHENIPKVTVTELEQLFEAYDSDNIGFVDVSFIKDKIRGMNLSEQALFYFMESVVDLADDEMVNLAEFKRLFKSYTASK